MKRSSTLDGLDLAILEELNLDARRSHREIASHLSVSPTTVASRVERMEREGVIRGYIPLLDDERLGFDLTATIGIRISKGRLREVEERLARISEGLRDLRRHRGLRRAPHRPLPGPPGPRSVCQARSPGPVHRADEHAGRAQPRQGGPPRPGLPSARRIAGGQPIRGNARLGPRGAMMDWGMRNRIARMFPSRSGNSVMVACDHGYFMGPTRHLEDARATIAPLLPHADVIAVSRGSCGPACPRALPSPSFFVSPAASRCSSRTSRTRP